MFKNVRYVLMLYVFTNIMIVTQAEESKNNSVHTQGFAPLALPQDSFNLTAVKEQIKNSKLQTVIFDVQADAHSGKKIQRKGLFLKRNNPLGTVLICHGYLGCKRDAIALKHLFPSYNVMSFDFRAHGELTENQSCTIGRDEAYDVIGAVKFIKSDPLMSKKPVMVYGYSMGAVASIEAQAQDESLFDGMILDCPFDSSDNGMRRGLKISIFGKEYPMPGKEFIIAHMYDDWAQAITNYFFKKITSLDSKSISTKFTKVTPVESIKKIKTPCLFIHCDNDKKVPTDAVKNIYENKPGFKELWITLGKGHFGSYNHDPEYYWYRVNKFLDLIVAGNIANRQQEKIYDHRFDHVDKKECR